MVARMFLQFVLVGLLALTEAQESCDGEGMFFNECGSPCGELLCDERDRGKGACIESCQPGCFCDSAKGFIRDENNRCIQEKDCPPQSCDGEGMFFNECGSPCGEPSCDERDRGKGACIESCQPGCFCDSAKGFIRDENNRCIQEKDCPPQSCDGEGMFFNECGSPCGEPSCDERDRGKGPCIKSCQPGCFCDSAKGFIRAENNKCIQEKDCPPLSDKCNNRGEVYKECSSRCGEATCEGVPQVRCANLCLSLCLCDNDNGYVRGPNGDCILLSNCPQAQNCQKNETYSVFRLPCGESLCPGYPQPPYSPGGRPIAGCYCSEGLLRHNGQCISPGDCPPCNVVNCFVAPCQFATCPGSPNNAQCMSNYCGGCNAIFYDSQCREVQCDGKPSN